jgi:WhiB family redox-sensing transcriptional regulator
VCRGCPARTECLDWAIDVGATDGIWGGLDELERRALQRERRSTTAAATRAE